MEADIRQYQTEALSILLEFQRVCEELGLRYYLTAGTLLGAVRHGGFIPWDDDVDVAMPRRDYDRLAALGPQYFSGGVHIPGVSNGGEFPLFLCKAS